MELSRGIKYCFMKRSRTIKMLTLLTFIPIIGLSQNEGGENQDVMNTSIRPDYGVTVNRVDTDTFTAWVNQAAILNDQGGAGSYFRNYLYPDSTVDVMFNNGMGPVWKHSFGQVLDLADALWFDIEGVSVADSEAYSLDSVALYYRYFRWNDNVPDTLIMQVWDDDEVVTVKDPGWMSGASYARVDYDYMQRKGANPVMETTYLLENKDTAGFDAQRRLVLPVGLPFDTGQVAVTFTFFPGHPSQEGDTIDVYNVGNVHNKVNAMIVYEFRDEVPYVVAGEYNHGLVVTRTVRYNINTNGWNGDYIPGTSWASSSGIYNFDMDFKVTYVKHPEPEDPTAIDEIESNSFVLKPNPATSHVSIEGEWLKDSEYIVHDLSGRSVLQGRFSSNENRLNVEALPSGSYIIRIANARGSSFQRLLIQ